MSDPLLLLRTYICENQKIIIRGEYICFGNVAFHKLSSTNYIMFKYLLKY